MSFNTVQITPRSKLLEQLDQLIDDHLARPTDFGLLLIRPSQFRQFNISNGFNAGDLIIGSIYEALQRTIRAQDRLFRVGGAEFLLVIQNLHNEGHATLAAIKLFNEVQNLFSELTEHPVINLHIGVAVFPEHGRNAADLLQSVEIAYIEARQKLDSYSVFSEQNMKLEKSNWGVGKDLVSAIDNDQFEMYFQPQVNLESGAVFGAEALLRWKHPEQGYVRPDFFIPLAEKTNLIDKLTDWTVHNALWLSQEWPEFEAPLNISINLSARAFMYPGLADSIVNSAKLFNIDLQFLTFEITESALMEDIVSIVSALDALKAEGIKVSIDDFGTGFSSMAYFKKLPADEVKIDKSFVLNMLESPMDMHIAKSIIDMAQGFGLQVVAEGIEDKETYLKLQELGCDVGQGYYVSKALAQQDFIDWVHQYSSVSQSMASKPAT